MIKRPWIRKLLSVPGLLFAAAFVCFYLGLGFGLQYSVHIGTNLWIAAAVLCALAIFVMVARRKGKQE